MKREKIHFHKFFLLFVCISIICSSLHWLFPYKNYTKIAHRGDVASAPENTMAAFHSALNNGFDVIELDIHLSKDKKIVVIHDSSVNRTTNGEGLVRNMSVSELQKLNAGGWYSQRFSEEKIPLLQEVLDEFAGKIVLLIEIKPGTETPEIVDQLATLLKQTVNAGVPEKMLQIQSFHIDTLQQFTQRAPDFPIGLVLTAPINLIQMYTYKTEISFLSIHYTNLTHSFIQQAQHYGYTIYAWTIATPSQFKQMQLLGVDGIISNSLERREENRYYAFLQSFIEGHKLLERFFV
ncbi:glycerophosphodiester phosphodiesterase family protein [Cytobacillus sp. FSL R5-0569]|uniref:glycerophosphodiester phosphodiesterase n=1 Tax=Cytobacillus sp. FSL R5-0569 TaxID=2921649 RepID=UPI0030FBCD60